MARSPAKKPTKKLQAPAVMLVVMKESEDGNGNGKKMRRSEEHTSELQSH